ncbi:DUF393 domain-containing protein [Moraxella sp. K127]|uniref:thiol-disulfide oxidoreductase DCC family protein n=1 Tax=Moraxella TaxID=475 RepID=UPI001880312A|nr:DUF393 domain-containing protein [Moraxella sp. K127]MBE9590463.1 DUF393 domain-containing protein [Moraxella sp. K127]
MIKMYYDDTCPICRTEAYHIKSDDIHIIAIKDGLAELQKHGIDELTAMTYLCVLDDNNVMHKGIKAVRLLHQTANTKFNKLLHLPIIKPLSAIIYPLFAKYRHKIPKWLIIKLFGNVQEINECDNGICQLSPKDRLNQHKKS